MSSSTLYAIEVTESMHGWQPISPREFTPELEQAFAKRGVFLQPRHPDRFHSGYDADLVGTVPDRVEKRFLDYREAHVQVQVGGRLYRATPMGRENGKVVTYGTVDHPELD